MQREAALAVGACVVIAAMVGIAALAPGVVGVESDEPEPTGHLRFQEATLQPASVSGETVELRLDTRLAHRGERSENVTVELRAIDGDTGLLEDEDELRIERIEGTRELAVEGSVTVEREGDYRIEVLVFQDDRRVAVGRTTVGGLDALQPEYAESPVEFQRFPAAGLPAVEYQIRRVDNDTAVLTTAAYLTNRGDDPEGDLEVELIARQSQSGIVADRERVPVGEIEPGRTAQPETTLEVPDEYDYYLDAILWRDGVIVDTARESASLDANRSAPDPGTDDGAEATVATEDFTVEEDGTVDGDGADGGDGEDGEAAGDDGQPGFGPGAALIALALGLLAARRAAGGDHQ